MYLLAKVFCAVGGAWLFSFIAISSFLGKTFESCVNLSSSATILRRKPSFCWFSASILTGKPRRKGQLGLFNSAFRRAPGFVLAAPAAGCLGWQAVVHPLPHRSIHCLFGLHLTISRKPKMDQKPHHASHFIQEKLPLASQQHPPHACLQAACMQGTGSWGPGDPHAGDHSWQETRTQIVPYGM